MSRIEVRWYNESDNIVIQEFSGEWDWDELNEAMKTSFEWMGKVEKPAALIVDMHHPDSVKNIQAGAYAKFQRIRAFVPLNLGLIIVVGVSPIMQSLARMFIMAVKHTKVRVEFVTSLGDVDRLLEDFLGTV